MWLIRSPHDERYLADATLQRKLLFSKRLDSLDMNDYDLVYMAGGWGAAFDFAQSTVLAKKVTEANRLGKILGSACHGALGFVNAKSADGKSNLCKGRRMTGVTDKQILQLGITCTPKHPESELRNAGALFEANSHWLRDLFATHVVRARPPSKNNCSSSYPHPSTFSFFCRLSTVILSLDRIKTVPVAQVSSCSSSSNEN